MEDRQKRFKLFFAIFISFCNIQAMQFEPIMFPEGFLKGVGLSAYQNGGHKIGYSNWSYFQSISSILNAQSFFGPATKDLVGYACGFWDNALNDIKLLKELGCTSFRFSIEWAEIEPVEGMFNEAALDFYERLVDELLRNGIVPMVTLYHWVHPYWFEQKGGFEKSKNIYYFVRYCAKVFERLGAKVPLWGTINEPTVIASCGYILGTHSPGNRLQFRKSACVLRNLLNAHVYAYKVLKRMPEGSNVKIGIVHQVLQAEAYDPAKAPFWLIGLLKNGVGQPLAKFLNSSFAHNVVKQFLKTGHYSYHLPTGGSIDSYNEDAPHSCDFIGINFYSKVIFGPGPTNYPGQVMTDMDYPSWPETLYGAIVDMSELGVPMYITENGIADAKDNSRAQFIHDYLQAVLKAVREGYDVRGYYYWTLMDNFEWNDGYTKKFGLYHVDFTTQKRTLREGAKVFRDQFRVSSATA